MKQKGDDYKISAVKYYLNNNDTIGSRNITFEIQDFYVSKVDPIIDTRIKTDRFI